MNVNRLLRRAVPIACLLAVGIYAETASAAPLVAQPNLVQAVAPVTASFHRYHGGWGYYGGYRGWGSYYYGRPALYYSYRYRPYRTVVRYGYGSGYYSSPYYAGYYSSPYYSTGYSGYGYGNSCCTPTVYSQPVVYARPVYSTMYSPAVYSSPVSFYSGYWSYPYSRYGMVGYGYGYGYPRVSPYYYGSGGYYGSYW